ncbi:MAG: spermidine/putrescine ABC transporter substrate-binding protein [Clostridia bacterium]|nr:spermidine/putrescine ABC transporter substrate-binding protein [Clostridia bacterium]
MMKKLLSFTFVAILLLTLLVPCVSAEAEKDYSHLEGTTLNVYNWGEYISDGSDDTLDVNAEFEKKYGITVIYSNYESNENMYNKLSSGGANYDVIIPSDYMIARLVEEDMLEELDFSNIPNYKYIVDKYKDLYYDPENKFSVPYTVGMVGLIYNTTMVEGEPDSWGALWDERYKGNILMFNNPRDAFGIAQFYLGQSVNTKSIEDWNKAIDALKAQNHLVSSYVMDEVFNKMERGDAALAPYYAGDFLTMYDVNPDLAFVYPKEGVNFFVDAMCIPKNAQNKEAAELYINFMLEEDIAVANANYICYASPHKLVLESDDYDLKGDPVLYPAEEDMPKTEMFENLDYETQNYMTMLWNELKIEGNSNMDAYIGLSITAALIVAYATYSFIKKKRREAMY